MSTRKNTSQRIVTAWLSVQIGMVWLSIKPISASGFAVENGSATSTADAGSLQLKSNDVVAFLGGESVVQQAETGHLESLLATAFPAGGVHYRNFGWEGDTVFEQPRDVNFPVLPDQLKRAGATVIVMQFGQQEALAGGKGGVSDFTMAYERLCDSMAKQTARIVLVTPAPFEKPVTGTVPDLTARNEDLKLYAEAVRTIAQKRGYPCADLFSDLMKPHSQPLTRDGLHANPRGAATIAESIARQLGTAAPDKAGTPDADGRWANPKIEAVRQAVAAKNKLWSAYWRPTNWAFLGGDRMTVPSSHDHANPSVRWFPTEMERYVPLIEQAEKRIDELAKDSAVK